MKTEFRRGLTFPLSGRPDGAQLAKIARLVEGGVIRPVVDQVFGFDQTPAALDRSASGRARGKIVVRGYQSTQSEQGA